MAKYLAPDGYLYDANSGLYYTQTVETDVAGNRTQNVLWFNAETGEYTRAQYKLPPVPPAPPAPAPAAQASPLLFLVQINTAMFVYCNIKGGTGGIYHIIKNIYNIHQKK